MKPYYLQAVCLLLIVFSSCRKDENLTGNLTGSLHIDIDLSIRVDEVSSELKSTSQTEDFKVVVFRTDGTVAMTFASVSEMPDTVELEAGNYYVEAHSDNNLPAAFENPYYYGVSEAFIINSNTQESVLVECALANSIVTVRYSGNITSQFIDYTTTVSSELGSLVFAKDETRMGYFLTLPLDITVELTSLNPDGSEALKTLSGTIPDPAANRHYEIQVDATPDGGMAGFEIRLDTTGIPVEIVEMTEDSIPPQNAAVGFGDLLITEIMYDPSALSDTEGEWFEILNNSDQDINLQNLILERDDANLHIISDSILLLPGEFFVFMRAGPATGTSNNYVYGSGILLPNTGAVLSIYNEGAEINPGELIFSLNYGEDDFPGGSGASISLDPNRLNATDAILGSSWCTSVSLYSTGDLGTPGETNDLCGKSE